MVNLKIRIKNPELYLRNRVTYPIPDYIEVVGTTVSKKPSWVSVNQFCLTTNDKRFPFRVIDKDDIISGTLI
jgi:hypothetical protein